MPTESSLVQYVSENDSSDNDLLFSDDFDEIVEDMLMLDYFL